MIVITLCQELPDKFPPRSRLNTTEWTGHWNIYTRGPAELSAAQEQKDFKFTWDINVNEHSRLSEAYDVKPMHVSSEGSIQRQWNEQACFQS